MLWKKLALITVIIMLTGCSPTVVALPTFTPLPPTSTSAPPTEQPAVLGEEFTLGIGQSAALDQGNIEITFARVDSDSRCPSDVECVWAGEVTITADVTTPTVTGGFSLTLPGRDGSPQQVDVDGYRITLVTVEPYPSSPGSTECSSYGATFLIEKVP